MSNIERRREEADSKGTENQKRTRVVGDKKNRAFPFPSKKQERSLREKERRQKGSPGSTRDFSGELGSARLEPEQEGVFPYDSVSFCGKVRFLALACLNLKRYNKLILTL